jgi:mono/diheme cytochrome c family protein
MKRIVWSVVATVVVLAVVAFAFMYSGLFNVAASAPGGGVLDWALSTTMDHSVRAHAKGIAVPPLNDSSMIDTGFDHYKDMCISCHGSPEGGLSEAGMGLNPVAPELSVAARDWTPAEIYWIVKNGVRMTGMPSFKPTHSEQDLWAIVAFVEKLKTMDADAYSAFAARRAGPAGQGESE